MPENANFRHKVERLMAKLPAGKVTTYGDLAAMAGSPRAARIVGGIAHSGSIELPWHRLVNARGGLARGFPGGPDVQRQLLEAEGVACSDFVVNDFKKLRWNPYGN